MWGSPGRFFAINEIKLMLAFTVLNYDIKMENGASPKVREFGPTVLPDTTARILYRKRR